MGDASNKFMNDSYKKHLLPKAHAEQSKQQLFLRRFRHLHSYMATVKCVVCALLTGPSPGFRSRRGQKPPVGGDIF